MSVLKEREILSESSQWAIEELESRGFKIRSKLSFGIDPKLQMMGYTASVNGGHRIVVSQWSLSSPMLRGLLVHELSHVILTEEGHPSHNYQLLANVLNGYSRSNDLDDETTSALRDSLNHIQDIYADDIGVGTFRKLETNLLQEFFENWAMEKAPDGSKLGDAECISVFASNAFALASLRRRNLAGVKSESAIRRKNSVFLKSAFPRSSFERTTNLYFDLVDFLSSLRPLTKDDEERFATDVVFYFNSLVSVTDFLSS